MFQSHRRQNCSCDPCRKSKRACDATIVDLSCHNELPDAKQFSYSHVVGNNNLALVGPCSNCRKWRKECTFEWAASRARRRVKKSKPKPDGCATLSGPVSMSANSDRHSGVCDVDFPAECGLLFWYSRQMHGDNDPCALAPSPSEAICKDSPQDGSSRLSKYTPKQSSGASSHHLFASSLPSAAEDIAERHTRTMVNCDLLRIYHDSLENALSCVLTEQNCPYSNYFYHATKGSRMMPPLTIGTEWGPTWTNRICARVCRADRAFAVVRGRTLTVMEERAVSKALHSTIVTFAMQWRASQDRSQLASKFPGATGSTSSSSSSAGLSLSMIQNYRNEALYALQKCAHIESLRVAFSFLLFSLANPPLDETTMPLVVSSSKADTTGRIEAVQMLLDSDQEPFFVETGVRRLFSLRYKLKRLQRKETAKFYAQSDWRQGSPAIFSAASDSTKREPGTSLMSTEDHETFQLLSWLAVIIDTVTAAVHGRPPTISDEDSTVSLDVRRRPGTNSRDIIHRPIQYGPVSLWEDLLFHSGCMIDALPVPTLQCSYDRAAAIICDSVPVKLLLFRRLTRIQTLLYRGTEADQLESAIEDTTRLLQFWIRTYGQFAKECMAHHGELPPRLQSWYVTIVGHWHLGAIFFARLIRDIDDARLGLESRRVERESTHYVYNLRKENAMAASDLARLSINGSSWTSSKGQGFHELFQGIQDGLLLTEPWANLLVRLFIQAAVIFLETLSENREGSPDVLAMNPHLHSDAQQCCLTCIDALRCLGQISDIAKFAAQALSEDLEKAVLTQCLVEIDVGCAAFFGA